MENKGIRANWFVELVRIVLAFIYRMRWAILVAAGLFLAWSSGTHPSDILNWIKDIVTEVAGG